MKTLADSNNVSAKSYYFLLDWNEQNERKFINEKFNKNRLCDLVLDEYMILWLNATTDEHNRMCALGTKQPTENASCAIFDVSKMLPDLEECNQASYDYADKYGKGEFGLVRVAYQEGINWALNYLTKRK